MRWMIILQEREERRWQIERNEGWRGGEED